MKDALPIAIPEAGGPGTVWCIGRNFVRHARELKNPVPEAPLVFLKSPGAVRGLEPAPVAFADETFDHECELVVRLGRDLPLGAPGALDALDAVAVGLDLTRRGVQQDCKARGLPWWPSKSFAGSAVVGPWIPREALGDPRTWSFGLQVGGEARQQGRVAEMIFDLPTLLGAIARHVPMQRGDLLFTGTPEGVGPIRVGDRFTLWLQSETGGWEGAGRL